MKKLLLLGLFGTIASLQASEPKFLTHVRNDSDYAMNMLIMPAASDQANCVYGTTVEAEILTTYICIQPGQAHRLNNKVRLNPHRSNAISILVNGVAIRLEDHDIKDLFQSTELIINKDTSWSFVDMEKVAQPESSFIPKVILVME